MKQNTYNRIHSKRRKMHSIPLHGICFDALFCGYRMRQQGSAHKTYPQKRPITALKRSSTFKRDLAEALFTKETYYRTKEACILKNWQITAKKQTQKNRLITSKLYLFETLSTKETYYHKKESCCIQEILLWRAVSRPRIQQQGNA